MCKKNILTSLLVCTVLVGGFGVASACQYDKSKGTIIVDKITVPSGDSQSFTFTTTGNGYNGFSLTDASAPNRQDLKPGIYSVTETPVAGWTQTSAICKKVKNYGWGGDCDGKIIDPSKIVLGPDDTIKCTFTNTKAQKGSITIKKVTVGGDDTFMFTGDVAGLLMNGNSTSTQVMAGTYTSTESPKTGWDLTSINCSDTDSTGNIGTGVATFKVAASENVTCIFTNTKKPTLTVIKEVDPETGDTGLFNLSINGTQYAADVGDDGSTGPQLAKVGLNSFAETAGTNTDLANYTSVISGDGCHADGTITLAAGDVKTCTITNTAKTGTLIVKKVVVNDNGGTMQAGNFSFSVNNATTTTQFIQDVSDPLKGENDLSVPAGTYNVTEPAVAGYAIADNSCVNVKVTAGGSATCTITNNDIQPLLKVTKVVANGPNQVSDFPLFVGASTVLSGVQNGFNAGTYIVKETNNFTNIYDTEKISGDCDSATGSVTLALGDVKSCTITNSDSKAVKLTVIKHVINLNGGNLNADDFTINVTGANVLNPSFAGSETGTDVILDAGTPYKVVEADSMGYAVTYSADCSGTFAVGGAPRTCTITNADKRTSLTLIKNVDCGKKTCMHDKDCADPAKWTLTATNVDNATSTLVMSGATPVKSVPGFAAGNYLLAETGGVDGYDAGDWNCTINGQTMTLAGGALSLAVGDTAVCTIVNTKSGVTPPSTTGQIKVIKYAIGGNGKFGFSVNATSTFSIVTSNMKFGKNSQGSWLSGKLAAGTVYAITETTLPNGWQQVFNGCKNVKVKAGKTVTCVVVNKKIEKPCNNGKFWWNQNQCGRDNGRYNDVFHGIDFGRNNYRFGWK